MDYLLTMYSVKGIGGGGVFLDMARCMTGLKDGFVTHFGLVKLN